MFQNCNNDSQMQTLRSPECQSTRVGAPETIRCWWCRASYICQEIWQACVCHHEARASQLLDARNTHDSRLTRTVFKKNQKKKIKNQKNVKKTQARIYARMQGPKKAFDASTRCEPSEDDQLGECRRDDGVCFAWNFE